MRHNEIESFQFLETSPKRAYDYFVEPKNILNLCTSSFELVGLDQEEKRVDFRVYRLPFRLWLQDLIIEKDRRILLTLRGGFFHRFSLEILLHPWQKGTLVLCRCHYTISSWLGAFLMEPFLRSSLQNLGERCKIESWRMLAPGQSHYLFLPAYSGEKVLKI